MLLKASAGVVARLPGGDQERPVTALQQEQLTGCLVQPCPDAAGGRAMDLYEPLHPPLGAMDYRPHPLRVRVQPGRMVAVLPPTALGQRDGFPWRVGVAKAARRTRLDGLAECEQAQDVANPLDTLEPPMSEQLGVVRGAHDAEASGAAVISGNFLLDE